MSGLNNTLSAEDLACLRSLIAEHGIERLARIAAALTDSNGEPGRARQVHVALLQRMAMLRKDDDAITTNAAASKVALEYYGTSEHDNRVESLTKNLIRNYDTFRGRFDHMVWSNVHPFEELVERVDDRSAGHYRAAERLTLLLDDHIDLYDALLADATRVAPDRLKAIRALGRERAGRLLAEALALQQAGKWLGHGIPRSFVDLIVPALDVMDKNTPV